ncbi:MAG: DUF4388 domain-containing protein [Candidatus Electrothrix sp. AR3]|nr:DUF4388 domain-containing protein [Candidatus Electrothrix sp. AR3]
MHLLAGIFAKESGNSFLDSIPLADLLQLIGMGNHSTDIMIINEKEQRGIIRIRQGNLIEAEAVYKKGVEAITEMLSWQEAKISTCKNSAGIRASKHAFPLHEVLIRAVAQLDEQNA